MADANISFKGVPVSLIYSKGRDTFCGDAGRHDDPPWL